jgi:hypothetical protein
MASKKKMPTGLLDPESEAIAEAYAAMPSVRRQTRGLLSLEPQQDQGMGQTALETALSFIPGVGQMLAARDIERARRANDPAAAAMAATEFVPFGRLAGIMRRPGPIMSEIDVYHGSPHRFEEFDASKIGTGEGAQAYGHGIYLAESPDVAKTYQSAQSPSARKATMTLQASDGNVNKAIAAMKKEVATMTAHKDSPYLRQGAFQETQDALNYLQQMKKGAAPQTGALYTADLPDEMVDRMLDWDKPLSEQPEIVKTLQEAGLLQQAMKAGGFSQKDIDSGLMEGRHLLSASKSGKATESEVLRAIGIPGVRYLDAGSRGQGGSGTRNFVVFPGEEKKVKIKKRE